MKKLSLLTILMMSVSMNVSANGEQAQTLDSTDVVSKNAVTQVQQGENKTLRLKFIGRRAYTSRIVRKEKAYEADDAWTGATYVNKDDSKARSRLNRRFVGKKPYINYQFD